VEAAFAIADAEGLTAVTIRRVAAELDVHPMSLYTHIASKADLFALMSNELVGLMLAEEPLPAGWREALSEITRRFHAAWVAHPWGLELFARGTRLAPNASRFAKQLAAAVAGLDLESGEVWTLLGIVNDYAIGHALRTASSGATQDLDEALSPDDLAEFPELSALQAVNRVRGSSERFEIGLQAVLDGVERRFLT
jgi:AcrR family transcriptional regulator